MPLTDICCRDAIPSDKPEKLSDGKGLYLKIMPNGSKYWRFKYRFGGKEKTLAFGVYPKVSLSEARDKREKARKMLTSNIDPSQEKKEAKRQNKLIKERMENDREVIELIRKVIEIKKTLNPFWHLDPFVKELIAYEKRTKDQIADLEKQLRKLNA